MMKGYIESDSQCKGGENLGQKKTGNHLFLASYIIYFYGQTKKQ